MPFFKFLMSFNLILFVELNFIFPKVRSCSRSRAFTLADLNSITSKQLLVSCNVVIYEFHQWNLGWLRCLNFEVMNITDILTMRWVEFPKNVQDLYHTLIFWLSQTVFVCNLHFVTLQAFTRFIDLTICCALNLAKQLFVFKKP